MFAWNDSLAPDHSRDSDGRLRIGKHQASVLASVYGTPLIVLDIEMIRRAIDTYSAICEPLGVGISSTSPQA
jgi:diaminopimelate decarboxylase